MHRAACKSLTVVTGARNPGICTLRWRISPIHFCEEGRRGSNPQRPAGPEPSPARSERIGRTVAYGIRARIFGGSGGVDFTGEGGSPHSPRRPNRRPGAATGERSTAVAVNRESPERCPDWHTSPIAVPSRRAWCVPLAGAAPRMAHRPDDPRHPAGVSSPRRWSRG